MASEDYHRLSKPTYFLMRMLWFVFTASILTYMGLALSGYVAMQGGADRSVFIVLYGLGIFSLLGSVVLRTMMLSAGTLSRSLNEAKSDQILSKSTSALLSPREKGLLKLLQYHLVPYILSLVLNETMGIAGLLLSIVGAPFETALAFMVIAIIFNLILFPTEEKIEALYDRAGVSPSV